MEARPSAFKRARDDAVGRNHELFDDRRGAVFYDGRDSDDLVGHQHRLRLDGLEFKRAVLIAASCHALRGCVLQLKLRGKIGACGNFGRRRGFAVKPGADAWIRQLRPVAHQCAVGFFVGSGSVGVDGILDHDGRAILIFVQRGDALRKLRGQHGEDGNAGVNGGRLKLRVLVDHRAPRYARVDVGNADEHADVAVGQLLGPLDLIEILRGVVIDGGPKQAAQIGETVSGRNSRLRFNCR